MYNPNGGKKSNNIKPNGMRSTVESEKLRKWNYHNYSCKSTYVLRKRVDVDPCYVLNTVKVCACLQRLSTETFSGNMKRKWK